MKRAAVSRGPGDSAFNRGKRRAPAPTNARFAKRPSEMRTTRARAAAGLGTRQSAACAATASANAEKWASNIYLAAVSKIARYRAGPGFSTGPTAAAAVAEAAAAAEIEALLGTAEETCSEALLEDWTNSMCARACSAVLVSLHASSCVVADARYTSSRHTARHLPVDISRRRWMARLVVEPQGGSRDHSWSGSSDRFIETTSRANAAGVIRTHGPVL